MLKLLKIAFLHYHLFFKYLQALNSNVEDQKTRAREVVVLGKKLLRENSLEDEAFIREKMDALKQGSDATSKLSSDRLGLLEQACPLATHFHDTHEDLAKWFAHTEDQIAAQNVPAFNTEEIKKQQDSVRVSMKNGL